MKPSVRNRLEVVAGGSGTTPLRRLPDHPSFFPAAAGTGGESFVGCSGFILGHFVRTLNLQRSTLNIEAAGLAAKRWTGKIERWMLSVGCWMLASAVRPESKRGPVRVGFKAGIGAEEVGAAANDGPAFGAGQFDAEIKLAGIVLRATETTRGRTSSPIAGTARASFPLRAIGRPSSAVALTLKGFGGIGLIDDADHVLVADAGFAHDVRRAGHPDDVSGWRCGGWRRRKG